MDLIDGAPDEQLYCPIHLPLLGYDIVKLWSALKFFDPQVANQNK